MFDATDAARRPWLAPLGWATVYLLVGVVGAVVQPERGQEPWYPAAAVGVGLLFLRGLRWWPVVLLCALTVSAVQYRDVVGALVSGTCTAAEIVLIVVLLRRLRFQPTFERADDMARLWLATLAAATLAASAGSGLLHWLDATDHDYWRTALVWFIGDGTGILLVSPTILLFAQPHSLSRLRALSGVRKAEVRVVVTASYALLIGYFAVTRTHEFDVARAAPFSLCLTPMLWVAVRAGLPRATLVVGTFDVVALAAYRVFAETSTDGRAPDNLDLVTLQMVVLAFGLATLGIAVSIDAAQSVRLRLNAVVEASPVAIVGVDESGLVRLWNRAAERMFGYSAAEAVGQSPPMLIDHAAYDRRRARTKAGRPEVVEYRHKDGRSVLGRLFAARIQSSAADWAGVALIVDVTNEAAERSAQTTLSAAVEQAGEAIVVTTPEPAIIYANPAALVSSGYSLEEVRGKNPRVFKSGRQDGSFYSRMWATLTAGEVWEGVLVNKRKDGSLYEERSTIAPVKDDNGELIAYVAVKRDLSRERLLESDLARSLTIRGTALAVMAGVERRISAAETAGALCSSILQVAGLEAAVVALDSDGNMTAIATAGVAMGGLQGQTLDSSYTRRYRDMIVRGAFVGSAEQPLESTSPWTKYLIEQKVTATMFTAICSDHRLVGMLILATKTQDGAEWMRVNLALGEELGAFASVLVGAQIDHELDLARRRGEIRAIIDEHRFHAVFQSCHDLYTREVRSYEALTRFEDGERPDVVFADAWRVGLGEELEIACARAAIDVANRLLGHLPVSINFSPEAILSGAVAGVLAESNSSVVVEVTEHVPIADYADLRRALDDCHVKVSVDDAGAGFASMRHILELRADVVKLDIALIRGIDNDLGRQALAAGLCHYAAETGTLLIAEGVETQQEVDAVRRLGVHQAQGYYFGRPAPLE